MRQSEGLLCPRLTLHHFVVLSIMPAGVRGTFRCSLCCRRSALAVLSLSSQCAPVSVALLRHRERRGGNRIKSLLSCETVEQNSFAPRSTRCTHTHTQLLRVCERRAREEKEERGREWMSEREKREGTRGLHAVSLSSLSVYVCVCRVTCFSFRDHG